MAEGRLYSCGLAALGELIPEGRSSPISDYLRRHAGAAELPWDEQMEACLRSPHESDQPLLDLAGCLNLQPVELLTVALAAAVETDLMCGRAIAELQAPLGGSRPTLGLLAAAFARLEDRTSLIENILTGAAVQSGLLMLLNEHAPLAERPVAVPVPLCIALNGRDAQWPGASLGLTGVPATPLPPSAVVEARRHAEVLTAGSQKTLTLRSMSAAEGKTAAHEIACATGRRALFLDLERNGANGKTGPAIAGLGPLLLLRKLLPVFCIEMGPGDRRMVPAVVHYGGPVLALSGVDGSIEANGETPAAWKLEVAPRDERRELWETAIGPGSLASRLASDYRHGNGRIAQLGRLARQECLRDAKRPVDFAAVAAASWVGEGAGLQSLAQPLPDPVPDEALVVSPRLSEELFRLVLRCRMREGLVERLGASAKARYHPGVRALFTGQSGTGKTLAAGWLATRLGLPLFRADLSAVTSKYIGETEKNLSQLLSRAEESAIILLFDEADSLFGKRTEVKESNDRFANAQTNYLLQRIESFDGIALLTSNSRSRFDPAFCRRLDMILDFPPPDPEERRALWLAHLGEHHRISPRDLNRLAAAADFTGGHIRNAVLAAAMLAGSESRPIAYADVLAGLRDEHHKLSKQMPPELLRSE